MCFLNRLGEEFALKYRQLERGYEEVIGSKPVISFDDFEGLNEGCPAQIWPNDEIKIWNELQGIGLLEAAAHEIGHSILRYQGLIALDIFDDAEVHIRFGSPNRIKDLCTEINNAISHTFLISMLQDSYGISSEHQKKLRCQSPEQIAECLISRETQADEEDQILISQLMTLGFPKSLPKTNNCKMTSHHIEGIIAYDIMKCEFEDLHYMKQVTDISLELKNAFQVSSEFLSQIHIGQDIDNQIKLLKQFFEALGYPACIFKILEPFPLIKSKSDIFCFSKC